MRPETDNADTPEHNRAMRAAAAVFLYCGILLSYGCIYPSGNHHVETPPFLALANTDLYSADFYVQEARQHFSPRTITEYIVLAFSRIGLSTEHAHFAFYAVSLASVLAGIWAIGKTLSPKPIVAGVLIFWTLTVSGTTLGDTHFLLNTPLPATYAMALVIWGIYFAMSRRWIASMGFFGAGCVLHFLIAVLPAILVLPFMLIDCARQRQWRVLATASALLAFGAGCIFIPMYVEGGTSSHLLSNAEFVHLYAFVRSPHHIVPSAWPEYSWLDAATFFGGGLACAARVQDPVIRRAGFAIAGLACFFLLLNYVFVEIVPLAIVAKLQFARMIPYAVFAVLLALATLFNQQFQAGRYILCGLLAGSPLMPLGGILLLALALSLPKIQDLTARIPATAQAISGIVFVCAMLPNADTSHLTLGITTLFAVLLVCGLTTLLLSLKRQQTFRLGAAVCLALSGAGLLAWSLLQGSESFSAIRLHEEEQNQMSRLAQVFERQSQPDALILIPPSLSQFRLLSHRSVLVDAKSRPFTDAGIVEWKRRLEDVLGTKLGADMWQILDERYLGRTPQELLAVGKRYGATHILTHRQFQPDVPTKVVAAEGDWVIWTVPPATAREEAR